MEKTGLADKQSDRRTFLKYLLSGWFGGFCLAVLYPLIGYLKPPEQNEVEVTSVSAGKISEIEKESSKIIRFGNRPVILIRTADDKLLAYDAVCTHLDCTVQYKKEMGVIWCACHNGKYDLTGRNISGPPPRPLQPYRVIQKGEEIFISKIT
ncbi:MAG: Rieske (2Fe-2S) protein [Bacteroidota bacterium]